MGNLFEVLDYKDISKCFSEFKLSNFDKNIKNLSPENLKWILRKFLEFFSGKTFLEIYQPKVLALDYLTYPELHEESIVFLTEHRLLQKIVKISSCDDFCLFDYIKLEINRIEKIISGIINLARFKKKKISNLTKYSKIFFKTSSYSFEIGLSLKFLKKKTAFLQFNFPKFSIIRKNLNFRKQEQLSFFFCQFFYIYFSRKVKIHNRKNKNLFSEKLIQKNKIIYSNINKTFFSNENFFSILKKNFHSEKKPQINFLPILEIMKKNFKFFLLKYLKKNDFLFILKKKTANFLIFKNLHFQKNKFSSKKNEKTLEKKNEISFNNKKEKNFKKLKKKKKFFFFKIPQVFIKDKFLKDIDICIINKILFSDHYGKKINKLVFCSYCLFLIYLSNF